MKITDFKPTEMIKDGKLETGDPHRPRVNYGIPIVYFHSWKDGEIHHQGFVDSIDKRHGGTVVLYSWFDGGMCEKTHVTKGYFDKCTFYSSNSEMRHASTEEPEAEKVAKAERLEPAQTEPSDTRH